MEREILLLAGTDAVDGLVSYFELPLTASRCQELERIMESALEIQRRHEGAEHITLADPRASAWSDRALSKEEGPLAAIPQMQARRPGIALVREQSAGLEGFPGPIALRVSPDRVWLAELAYSIESEPIMRADLVRARCLLVTPDDLPYELDRLTRLDPETLLDWAHAGRITADDGSLGRPFPRLTQSMFESLLRQEDAQVRARAIRLFGQGRERESDDSQKRSHTR